MVFSMQWNANDPDGDVALASDIDQIFRDLKVAIGERLDQLMNFTENDEAGEVHMLTGTARIGVGIEDARPEPSGQKGEAYYATDTNKLFVTNLNEADELEWVSEPVAEAPKYVSYNDALAAGSKAVENVVTRQVAVRVVGPVSREDVGGVSEAVLYVDVSEFENPWDVQNGTLAVAATSVGVTRNRVVTGWTAIDQNRLRFTFMDVYGSGAGTPPSDGEFVEFTFIAILGKEA